MLLDENRLGTVLVQVDAPLREKFDFALLGMNAKRIGPGMPVFTGVSPSDVTTEALIALGSQLNVAGMADIFHMVGVTPDASDLERAFGGRRPERTVTITREDLEGQRALLMPKGYEQADFVMLGCPHYTYDQICRAAQTLKQAPAAVPVWVLTSAAVAALARSTGIAQQLEENGAEIVPDTCVDEAPCWGHLAGQCGFTVSPKCAYYMRAFGVELDVTHREACLELAAKGGKKT